MKTAALRIQIAPKSRQQLVKLARQWGRTPSEAGARLLEEELRRQAFSHIEFRTTPTGRQAYLTGTRLGVWQVVGLLEQHGGSIEKTARYLRCPPRLVRAAQLYARAYPDEIGAILTANRTVDFETLSRILPGLEKAAV
jgi:uncharacterized protein (DUF433 family)